MEYNDDQYYEYRYNDENELLPDMDIFNRGSYEETDTLEAIAHDAGVVLRTHRKYKQFDDKIGLFYTSTWKSGWHFQKNYRYLGLKKGDVLAMMKSIKKFPNFRNTMIYKNPSAFVLGYALTNNSGGKINQKILEKIIRDLPAIQEEKAVNTIIKQADLIRYARLWLRFYGAAI